MIDNPGSSVQTWGEKNQPILESDDAMVEWDRSNGPVEENAGRSMRRNSSHKVCGFGLLMLSVSLAMTGCATVRSWSFRGVECNPPEVISSSPLGSYVHKTVGIAKFQAPPHSVGAVEWLTRIYMEKVMQDGPFRQIKPLGSSPATNDEALLLGRSEHCDLVLIPTVVSLIESSGAMPTELQVSVQLLEVATGRVLIFIRQKASSQPGHDVDLVWNIIDGQPALRSQQLCEILASQQARFMASMAAPPLARAWK